MATTTTTMIKPMLCKEATAFDDMNYIYEVKLNGVRCIAYYPNGVILDGEVVCPGPDGLPDFNLIQHRIHVQDAAKIARLVANSPAQYNVFDILHDGEESLLRRPLMERKNILTTTLQKLAYDQLHEGCTPELWSRSGLRITAFPDVETGAPVEHVWISGHGLVLYRAQERVNGEGIVAKPMNSHYLQDNRSVWIKSKIWHEDVFAVCGVTEGKNGRTGRLGALVLGKFEDGKWVYHGEAGSGLSEYHVMTLPKMLKGTRVCPFPDEPKVKDLVAWTIPEVYVEVQYFKLQDNGRLIHPSIKRVIPRGGVNE